MFACPSSRFVRCSGSKDWAERGHSLNLLVKHRDSAWILPCARVSLCRSPNANAPCLRRAPISASIMHRKAVFYFLLHRVTCAGGGRVFPKSRYWKKHRSSIFSGDRRVSRASAHRPSLDRVLNFTQATHCNTVSLSLRVHARSELRT